MCAGVVLGEGLLLVLPLLPLLVVLLLLLALLALLLEVRAQRFCPGRKPPFWTVKRPARAYKSAMHSRFTMENTKCA